MTFEEFRTTVATRSAPEEGWNKALQALWWEARGEWDRAHDLCQEAGSREGDWVHAYLHRKEGDESNAAYWYSRAGKTKPAETLEEEWRSIARALLG